MSKAIKKIFFILFIFILIGTYCFATETQNTENMSNTQTNTTNTNSENVTPTPTTATNTQSENTTERDSISDEDADESADTVDTSSGFQSRENSRVTSVNSFSSLPESQLGLSNILSILLISVGVLLILFSIAILIRLK